MNDNVLMETDEILLKPLLAADAGDAEICRAAAAYGGAPGCFGVIAKEYSELIGFVLCPTAEITVYITPGQREQGYGATALALGLDLLFGSLGRQKLRATCERKNIAAVKTLLCCGMEEERSAENRDFCAVLTVDNWELL